MSPPFYHIFVGFIDKPIPYSWITTIPYRFYNIAYYSLYCPVYHLGTANPAFIVFFPPFTFSLSLSLFCRKSCYISFNFVFTRRILHLSFFYCNISNQSLHLHFLSHRFPSTFHHLEDSSLFLFTLHLLFLFVSTPSLKLRPTHLSTQNKVELRARRH